MSNSILPGVNYLGGRGPGWRVIDARSGRQTPGTFAAVALAIDLDDRAVVHQPVHCRNGHGTGGEDVLPLAERLV